MAETSPVPDQAGGTVVCPQCGAENQLASGERILACQFCDTPLFVDRSRVVGHYRLPRLLDRQKATAALNRWMAGNRTVKDLDRKSSLRAVDPITFPLWMFRTETDGAEVVFAEPAAPTPIPQLADLKIPAGKLEPFREPEPGAEAAAPTVPLETARGWLDQRGAGELTESALVEVPLWRARYDYRGETFQALVDGSTGQVLASVFPEKAESPYILVAVLGLILFGVEGLAIDSPLLTLVAYAITAVPLVLLAWWVTRKV